MLSRCRMGRRYGIFLEAEVASTIPLCRTLSVYHVDIRASHIPGGRGFSPHLLPTACLRPGPFPLHLRAQVSFFHSVRPRAWSRASACLSHVWLVSLRVHLPDSSLYVAADHPCPGLYGLPPCASTAVNGAVLLPLGRWVVLPQRPLGNTGARVLWGPRECLAAGHHWCGSAHTQEAAAAPASPSLPTAACEFQLLHVLAHTPCCCRAFVLLRDAGSVTPKERSKAGEGWVAGALGTDSPGLRSCPC